MSDWVGILKNDKRVKGYGVMPLMEPEPIKTEKIDGVVFNMLPSGGFMHSQINGNIYHAIKRQIKNSVCAAFYSRNIKPQNSTP